MTGKTTKLLLDFNRLYKRKAIIPFSEYYRFLDNATHVKSIKRMTGFQSASDALLAAQ